MSENLLAPTTSAIIDGVALIIILIFFVIGAKKGFTKTFFSVFGGFISLLLAVLLCSSVASFLQNRFGTVTSVSGWLEGVLRNIFGETLMDTTLAEATEENLGVAGIAGWMLKIVLSIKDTAEVPMDVTLNQVISPVFAYYLVAILCTIGLYIIFKIIFFLIGEIVGKFHKITPVRVLDKTLGAIFGLIRGIIIIDLWLLIIKVIPIGFFQTIVTEIQNTTIVKFLESFNLFGYITEALINSNLIQMIIDSI